MPRRAQQGPTLAQYILAVTVIFGFPNIHICCFDNENCIH